MAAVPIFSLILIRLFWSGSSLWFLTVGIILLGAAAISFLARRTGDQQYGAQVLAPEPSRLPLVLGGLGVLFLAMLILPNFAGGDSTRDVASPAVVSDAPASDVAGVSELPEADTPRRVVQQDAGSAQPGVGDTTGTTDSTTTDTTNTVTGDSTTYVVQDGDTLWDISLQFDVSVDAIVAANGLADETAISIDQELIIPASSGEESSSPAATEDDEAGLE